MTPIPPLSAAEQLILLVQLASLLCTALVLGRVVARFGMPAIVGELLAGVLLGPSVLGHTWPAVQHWLFPPGPAQQHLLDAVGQFGVLLLVGIAGAHLDLASLRRRGAAAVRISLLGLVIPLALGLLAGFYAPGILRAGADRAVFGLFVGVAMCVTAIPVIAKTLADMNLLHREVGQLTMTAGMVDDAVGWFLLSVVSAMATVGVRPGSLTLSLLYLIGFVLACWLVGRHLVAAVMKWATRSEDAGTPAVAAVVLILLGSAVTQALHLESVFGAFVVGVLLGGKGVVAPQRLAPLRTVVLAVLAPVFIATAGLRMDLTALRDPTILLAAVVALLIAIGGKFAGAYAGARLSRMGHWAGLAMGAGMNSRGVVEIVVASVGLRLGVLNTASYTVVALIAVVTSLMAPPILRIAMTHVEQNAEEQLRQQHQAEWSTNRAPI
jgi:Kef-type K+ transport system membrane component KefB